MSSKEKKFSEKEWEKIFKTIPQHAAVIDLEYNIIVTNRSQYSLQNKCYKSFFEREAPCEKCFMKKIKLYGETTQFEMQHDNLVYEIRTFPIFDKHKSVYAIVEYYTNNTKEREFEQQLRQADKLASLGQLVSGIGHEINNPNQFIKGNIEILKRAVTDMLPIVDKYYKDNTDLKIAKLPYLYLKEHIMILLEDMAQGSQRIKNIVESLKRFARKDDGFLEEKVNINSVVKESAKLVQNQVNQKANIHLKLDENIVTFPGNSQKIEQVIVNLMINASQAMSESIHGDIWVETSKEGKYILLQVSDNGIGMSDHTMKQLFDPFFTTKRNKGGTGLGLSIAYSIVQEHSGEIFVESKQGKGTTFKIKIPITP